MACSLGGRRRLDLEREGHHGKDTDLYSGLENFATVVSPLVTAAQIPHANQLLARGDHVDCGAVQLDAEGMHRGTNKALAWPELEEIGYGNGTLTIRKRGKWLPWANIKVSKVATLDLLLTIAATFGQPHGARLPAPTA